MKWTGWPPETIEAMPIPRLLRAIDLRVEHALETHPFAGGGKAKTDAKAAAPKSRAELEARMRDTAARLKSGWGRK